MEGREKNKVFVALFIYWCLYMLVQQILSIYHMLEKNCMIENIFLTTHI